MPLHTAETLATGHGCSSQRQDQGSTADIGVDNKLCTPCTCAGVAPREETSQQCTKAAAASAGCSDAPCSCKEGKSGGAEAVHCPSRLDAALRMTDRLQVRWSYIRSASAEALQAAQNRVCMSIFIHRQHAHRVREGVWRTSQTSEQALQSLRL